jgi:hypothetical protein
VRTLLVILMVGAADGRPLDACRVNRASVRVDTDFVIEFGTADRNVVAAGAPWTGKVASFVEDQGRRRVGRWESDGFAVHIICRPDSSTPATGLYPYELLVGPRVAAFRRLDGGTRIVVDSRLPAWVLMFGPFGAGGEPFPEAIDRVFPRAEPSRCEAIVGGYATVIETYRRPSLRGEVRWDVAYDPNLSGLPRSLRILEAMGEGQPARARELYVTEARRCAAGGFVPTEWYEVSFEVEADAPPPREGLAGPLVPAGPRVDLAHFKVTRFADKTAPVALDPLDGIVAIAATRTDEVLDASTRTLTFQQLRDLVDRWPHEPPSRVWPSLDAVEMAMLSPQSPAGSWGWYLLGALAAVVLIGSLARRSRQDLRIMVVVAAGLAGMPGCGWVSEPVVRLAAGFVETYPVYEPGTDALEVILVLQNEGNVTVRLKALNGAPLPASLAPGRNRGVPIRLPIAEASIRTEHQFRVDTDRGPMEVVAVLCAIPRWEAIPCVAVPGELVGDEDGSAEVTLRVVRPAAAPPSGERLRAPPGLRIAEVRAGSGAVGAAPDLAYEERTYRVSVTDRALGLRRAELDLIGSASAVSAVVPVVWRRVEGRSTVPDPVVLATRPIRVYLRDLDPQAAFGRVRAAPAGIDVLIRGPRELEVSTSRAPATAEGSIEVESRSGGSPYRIAVVRPMARPIDEGR